MQNYLHTLVDWFRRQPWARAEYWARSRWTKKRIALSLACIAALVFTVSFVRLWRIADASLDEGLFANTIDFYAAPRALAKSAEWKRADLDRALHESGYSTDGKGRYGLYVWSGNTLEVSAAAGGAYPAESARLRFDGDKIVEIVSVASGKKLPFVLLQPRLVANMARQSREWRRLVEFNEIPAHMKNALLAVEDKRFYYHAGFDLLRLTKAVMVNVKSGRKEQGGSTITMQLARNVWLTQEKTWQRKAAEAMMTLILEIRLSKDEILEHYCNQIYLGRKDTFDIRGFGEAARSYLNKDITQITLPEAALLAGMVQRPAYFDPLKHAGNALERRNLVLQLMNGNKMITDAEYQAAIKAPLLTQAPGTAGGSAPYFLALAKLELQSLMSKLPQGTQQLRVYTTLDEDMQRDADVAVQLGLARAEKNFKEKTGKSSDAEGDRPQGALVSLDPVTGAVKAAVGGRSYAESQLNRVLAKRQPGSSFKPFVYATALASTLDPKSKRFTPATMLKDEPTMFKFGDETYQPNNFGQGFMGPVTMRSAMKRSLNIATVSLAQQVGYKKISDFAKTIGFPQTLRGTPSIALGSYEATPLEVAGAYTIFPNDGVYTKPFFVKEVRDGADKLLYTHEVESRQALDKRVAFLMLDMLRDVIRGGTGAGAYSYGLFVDMAGKTGSSRDGWFAGFTRGLIAVAWVGFDDNRNIVIEGSKSALPVWGEYMKRALKRGDYAPAYGNPPQGLTSAEICTRTGKLAGSECDPEKVRTEFFIVGSAPAEECTYDDHLALDEEFFRRVSGDLLPEDMPMIAPRARGTPASVKAPEPAKAATK
jgi:penicillin-binding protein 1B